MPPLAIAAGVAAVGTIGGAMISSSAQKKASNQAATTQQNATNAQLQLGQQSLAQQLQLGQSALDQQWQLGQQGLGVANNVYKANYGLISPFVANGLSASNNYNALLGLPAAHAAPAPDLLAGVNMGSAPHIGTPAPTTGTTPPVTGSTTPHPVTPTLPSYTQSNALGPSTTQYTPEQIARMRYAAANLTQ